MLNNVRVARATDLSNTDSKFVLANIELVLEAHSVRSGEIDVTCLTSVCLGCESIAMAATPDDRDSLVQWYDFTCGAHPRQSYVFQSVNV